MSSPCVEPKSPFSGEVPQKSSRRRSAGTGLRAGWFRVPEFRSLSGYPASAQLRRATVSTASNIAEGCGREGERELVTYLSLAAIKATKQQSVQ